ncbi:hypothetical protein KSP40_PGU020122 [Platanthera guangdongensis]|uniref:Uncharacterized protein n=1 Tax=Platanthera guangdongensis TaxID=2320717 RepID=A0ABR2LG20_9ASPA
MSPLLSLPELSSLFGGTLDARRRIAADGGGGRTLRNVGRSICAHDRVAIREQRIVRVSDPVKIQGLNPIFSVQVVPVSPPSPPPPSLRQELQRMDGGDDKQEYYVNLGHAIRTLREDYPIIFYKEPGFDIYRDDIVFKDPLNTFAGIKNYKSIFCALRFIGPVLFKCLRVDVVNVWQPVESTIMIRWTIHGVRRVPWESHGRFDGISMYKLDRKGKIFEHRVDNIARNPPARFKIAAMVELIQSLGSSSTPKPTYFQTRLRSDAPSMPLMLGFCSLDTILLCLSLDLSCFIVKEQILYGRRGE